MQTKLTITVTSDGHVDCGTDHEPMTPADKLALMGMAMLANATLQMYMQGLMAVADERRIQSGAGLLKRQQH